MTRMIALSAALFIAVSLFVSGPAFAMSEQQELIEKSVITIQKLADRDDTRPHVRKYLKSAKGVLVLPSVLKAGFIVGAEGGSGVLLAKSKSGDWSYPAFYTMGAASFGLQIGGAASESMLIIMTSKGLSAILNNKVKVGGELNAAVGPYGVGIEGATSAALGADIITYTVSKGAFIGGGIEGAIIEKRDEMNQTYYNDKKVTPQAIILDGKYGNPEADRLRQTLAGIK